MARQIEAGELHDGDALTQHFRDFYTTDQIRAIEVIAQGWQDMAAFADGAMLEWTVLYHDLGKQVIAGQRDALLPLLEAMMLVDSNAWQLFDPISKAKFRQSTLAVFANVRRRVQG